MDRQELLTQFNKCYSDYKEYFVKRDKESKELINHFLDRFGTVEKLQKMDIIKDYAFKTKQKDADTLCNLIDFKIDSLGINRCSRQSGYQRYGIQLTEDDKWLPFSKDSKNSTQDCERKARETFEHYKNETIKLVKMVEDGNMDGFDDIDMPQPHKNKLHFIFSKGNSISIYVHLDLNRVLDTFGIPYNKKDSVFSKRQLLLNFYNDVFKGSNINPHIFMVFLYYENGLRYILRTTKYKIEKFENKYNPVPTNLNVKVHGSGVLDEKKPQNDGKDAETIVYDCLKTKLNDLMISSVDDIRQIHLHPEQGIHCDFAYKTKDGKRK